MNEKTEELISKINKSLGFTTDYIEPYTVVENYIFDIQGLSPTKKIFLLQIRKYVGSKNLNVQYGYPRIMKDIGISSKATLSKTIKFFEWLHILEKINTKTKSGDKGTNLYSLNIKNIELICNHFKSRNYTWKEVEKHWETEYKKTCQIENIKCHFLE